VDRRVRWPRPARLEVALVLLLIAVGIARIVSTYRVFSATYDEPVHLMSGIEWLQFGRLTFNRMHPPLSRVFIAVGPYIEGVRWQGKDYFKTEAIAELHSRGHYWRTLALARIGVLPFFVLAVWVTWWIARTLFGPTPAVMAVGALTMLPPILAHAGLATTDMAITGFLPVVLILGWRWLDDPKPPRTLALGVGSGIATLLKFSALGLIPACLVGMLLVKLVLEPGSSKEKVAQSRRLELPTLFVVVIAFLTLWAGYLFHVGTLAEMTISAMRGSASVGDAFSPAVAHARVVPAPEFWHGLITLLWFSNTIQSYALGTVTSAGRWYFFPLAIAVKTPIAFLVLALIGTGLTLSRARSERRWTLAIPLMAALAILAVAMNSNLGIGLRHVLPIYPLLSILAGVGSISLWQMERRRLPARVAVILLGGWLVAASIRAHPDYLAAFNEVGSKNPEHLLLNSDVDYGQDVGRLADTVRARGIDSLTVYLFSFPDDCLLSSPRYVSYPDWHAAPPPPTTGWIAASAWVIYGFPGIPWLANRTPVTKVGRSVYLFYVPPDSPRGAGE
jgi:hypothetical protein